MHSTAVSARTPLPLPSLLSCPSRLAGGVGGCIAEKARLAEETLWRLVGGRDRFAKTSVELVRSDRPDAHTNDDA